MIRFANPGMLLLLLLLPFVAFWLMRRRKQGLRPRMQYSSLMLMGLIHRSIRSQLLGLPVLLLVAACGLMIVAMARPQSAWREHQRYTEGIDIMLVIDISGSMRALDFKPNRMEKAKAVVKDFIDGRSDDQIGIVIFAAETFTLCPLTHDYAALRQYVDYIKFGIVDEDGTAIGMGLANAADRLQKSKAKSKVAILLTDGENNRGKISPLEAAKVAQELGVRVYTIGVGTPGGNVPIQQGAVTYMMRSQLNVAELTNMAKMTGGQFFLATDGDSLEKIYKQIDRMERTKIETETLQYYDELGQFLMIPALMLLLLGYVLEHTWLRTFP